MMEVKKPLVSIGMPVYNAAKTIAQGIEVIRAQEFTDWEMFISDNGSTDNTWDVIQEYMKVEPRISAGRVETNLGQAWNFNRTFRAARGKYFMWQSDHDLRHPTYLSRTTSILENDPECVLVFCNAVQLDQNGKAESRLHELAETRGMSPVDRYIFIMSHIHFAYKIYGMIRREALAQTKLFTYVWGTDAVVLADLALRGSFAHIEEPLFYPCRNRVPESHRQAKHRVMTVLDPVNGWKETLKCWQELRRVMRDEHLDLLRKSSLSLADRWHAMLATIDWYQTLYGV